jgi:hypothetical protein
MWPRHAAAPDLDWHVGIDLELGRIHGDRVSPPSAAATYA